MTLAPEFTPPTPRGSTFSPTRDGKRLNAQARRVFDVMKDGVKRSLAELGAITGDPPASVSARYRDLKRSGLDMRKEYVANGLWLYWMHIDE